MLPPNYTMSQFEEWDEECRCGKCRLCLAYAVSDYDTTETCGRCNGAGCTKCEEN